MKTAQILIVGDEILSGRTADTNSHFLARALFVRGVRVRRIEVIPDDSILIAQWIHEKHALSDYVFVCGGIGGTPDDLTREAVARGVGVKLKRHAEAEKILLEFYGDRANPDRMSMSDLPEGCRLIANPLTKAPGFAIKNIFVFAGIPQILRAMWENVREEIGGEPLFEREINLKVGEGDIARFMVQLNGEFPLLELGSYPHLEADRGYRTQLVFRSVDKSVVEKAVARFLELAPGTSVGG